MRTYRFAKLVSIAALTGCLFQSVNCLPSKNQIYSTINSGLLNGIQVALTLGVNGLVTGLTDSLAGASTDATTDTTDTTDTTE